MLKNELVIAFFLYLTFDPPQGQGGVGVQKFGDLYAHASGKTNYIPKVELKW